MIQQSAIGLNSRSEASPYNEEGFLPLITAPMSSVVDETNYQEFVKHKIRICFPRTANLDMVGDYTWKHSFHAVSLADFIEEFVENTRPLTYAPSYRCIDTANGNIPELHEAIRKAKEIHGDTLIIMAGNVASVEAFVELAKTGVDYIRVGIGGGGGCNTTSNTGVGQNDLEELVRYCSSIRKENPRKSVPQWYKFSSQWTDEDIKNINKVKIVADGISSYVKLCEQKYGFNDNGYAAINKLLFAGADLVMIGKLFAQCLESAGDKTSQMRYDSGENWIARGKSIGEIWNNDDDQLIVKYLGMSTQEEQKKYKTCPICKGLSVTADSYPCYYCNTEKFEQVSRQKSPIAKKLIKPSEGSVQWIPLRWTLDEWLNGAKNQDEYPYLMGWTNSIKSAMAYTGKTKLYN